VKPLDRRLLTYARATRGYLVVCVGLGLAAAALIIAQATVLAAAITAAFVDGAELSQLGTSMTVLAGVIGGRAAALDGPYRRRWLRECEASALERT
jgi:hypothetical protein